MSTITGSYKKHMHNNPDKIAIRTSSETINYREWYNIVSKTANWLHSHAGHDRRIAIFLPNGIAFLQLFTGAAMAGCTAVTFDTRWKPAELKQRLALSSPSVLITTKSLANRLQGIDVNILFWEDTCEQIQKSESLVDEEGKEDTLFYMGFTSGTTGMAKAFVRTHDSWVASFACSRHDFHLAEADYALIPGTLIHSHFLYGAASTLYLGGTIYLMEKFSPLKTLNLIDALPLTAVYVVPTMVEAMLKEKATICKPLKMISSGAKWEENSKRKIQGMFPQLTMFEFYGASELSFVSVSRDDENKKNPLSVGKPCHNVEVEIRLANREKAQNGEIGKIFVRSSMLISGYVQPGPPAITIRPIKDEEGWATVDDMGYLDEKGYLYITGREKNMILYGGINLFPEEIESVLAAHPGVEEAAVVGIEDSYWGQIAVAVIKGNASKSDLKKLCKENLTSYKLPRRWYFVKEIPHTSSGKIARADVRRLIESGGIANETGSHCQSETNSNREKRRDIPKG